MPRYNIYVTKDQDEQLNEAFGTGANRSGVIRAAVAVFLELLGRDRSGRLRREAELLAEISDAADRVEALLSDAAKARVRARGGRS